MPKRKSAVDEKVSFNECLEILATEGIDSENVPAELKGWVLVTALKKSSQTVHDQIFNDLYNNVLNGESGVRVSAPVEYRVVSVEFRLGMGVTKRWFGSFSGMKNNFRLFLGQKRHFGWIWVIFGHFRVFGLFWF